MSIAPWARVCSKRRTKSVCATNWQKRGIKFERQKPLPLVYDGVKLACAYRMDLVVEDSIVVEIKSIRDGNVFTRRS